MGSLYSILGGTERVDFLLLYTGGGMPETEEQQADVVRAWGAWYAARGEAVVDGGNPFMPVAKKYHQQWKSE